VKDSKGTLLDLTAVAGESNVYQLKDERYSWITVKPGKDDKSNHYIVIGTDGHDWPFQLTKRGPLY
jgi:hypothetical protein